MQTFRVETISAFDKQLKRLSKKYPSLKAEFLKLIELLEQSPERGVSIGHDCYKLRLAIESKGSGKSGGARVIYFVNISDTLRVLLSIYDKSEKENISEKELQSLLKRLSKN
jgi:mRNA-degrading endonuclease RelE of RelBE toxin-antitoxin system